MTKTLIGTIQSEANLYCQNEWITHIKKLKGNYDILIVDNCYDDGNFEYLKKHFKFVLKGPCLESVKERIIVNRNIVLEWFRNHNEYENLLFIDSDIAPPMDGLNLLLKNKKDIVASVCWIVGNAMNLRIAWNFEHKDIKNGNHIKYMGNAEQNKCYIRNNGQIVKIAQTGLGFTLFNGKMLRKEKDIMFRDNNGFQLNEDFTFVNDLKEKGYKCWIDLKINCAHDLRKVFRGENDG